MSGFTIEREYICSKLSDRFKVSSNGTDYTKQYSHMYTMRTAKMKGMLRKISRERWGSIPLADRVIDTEGSKQHENEWAIVGVLYKEMKLRSSVLEDFKGSGTGKTNSSHADEKLDSDADTLILEDESGRVTIGGEIMKPSHFVSGVLIALRGFVDNDGVLQVSDYITYDSCYRNSPPSQQGDERFLMLVSGLGMGRTRGAEEMVAANDPGDVEMGRQLLLDWLSGRVGSKDDMAKAAKVARLILAGDSVDVPTIDSEQVQLTYGPTRSKLEKEYQLKCSNIVKGFDAYLAMGLATLPVDVMPGKSDPTVQLMPQQPLHPCLLPLSSRFSSLSLVTNPYECTFGEMSSQCLVMGHSGQPTSDILRQTELGPVHTDKAEEGRAGPAKCLQALKRTLEWGHLAPTAPDTLACYPLTDADPFIIPTVSADDSTTNAPHVLFAGNQPCFATEMVGNGNYQTRLVCIPKFCDTGTAVLVNMRTLEVSTVNFQMGGSE